MIGLSILGATGSIGQSALEIVRRHPDTYAVQAMTCARNIEKILPLIREFQPQAVAVLDGETALALSRQITGGCKPEILVGSAGFMAAAAWDTADITLLAMVGAAGLEPALAAINAGKKIALANKETLVMAGEIVMSLAREKGVDILPVDSEHSAIFQCLAGNREKDLKKVFLTASGGPFTRTPFSQFSRITREDALNHPNWSMGPKITIDSATLMNKGLELIEAMHLFNLPAQQIEVVVHPQSIVHSMVGYADGSVIAQMGIPDMRQAIGYAFSYPRRMDLGLDFPDFTAMQGLTFMAPDLEKFPSLAMAFEAGQQGGTLPAVMNAANEVVVQAFLEKRLGFLDIFHIISKVMGQHRRIDNPDLSGIIEADCWARETAASLI
ncbi:MAG: 1-deoxy-D-xylulose-5-phosphate reductoisomerase [Desulfobacterales bacterium]|nr:1-deoxy-D-xylulose-5-phosphate reductoisomerase [Desulfobacterales bacterium]